MSANVDDAAADTRGDLAAAADDERRLRLAKHGSRAEDVVVPALLVLPRHARMYVSAG